MQFNENLIKLRKEAGLSQEQLGSMLDVTRQTIEEWEIGATTPEMNELLGLSKIFKISVDELIGNDTYYNKNYKKYYYGYKIKPEYEYKSKHQLFGLPLVHINTGYGLKKARGIIAIGNIAEGVIAIGGFAIGIITLAGMGLGLLSLSGLSLGLLLAIGGGAIGCISIGGLSIGVFAVGGCAIGIYALGGAAIAKNIALGGYASAHIAIGDEAKGAIQFVTKNGLPTFSSDDVRNAILKEFPHTLKIIVSIFSSLIFD